MANRLQLPLLNLRSLASTHRDGVTRRKQMSLEHAVRDLLLLSIPGFIRINFLCDGMALA